MAEIHKKYRHIIWDWNGTLLDDAWLCVEIINGLLQKYGKPTVTLEQYKKIFDFPVKKYYRRLGFDFSKTPFEMVGTEFIEAYHQRWKQCSLHKNAELVLRTIQRAGIDQSVLSAADNKLVQAFVSHYHLSDYFAYLQGLNNHYAAGKMDIGRKLLAKISVEPSQVLLIGDTVHDCQVARDLKIDFLLFTGGHHSLSKLKLCKTPRIDNLHDALDYLNLQ